MEDIGYKKPFRQTIGGYCSNGTLGPMIGLLPANENPADGDILVILTVLNNPRTHLYRPEAMTRAPGFLHSALVAAPFAPQRHLQALERGARDKPAAWRRRRPYVLSASGKDQVRARAPGLEVCEVATAPIPGQRTGTSGLRVRTSVVSENPRFVPNLVQALFTALGEPGATRGATLVVGGDGRFYNEEAIQTIVRVAAGNGFARVVLGRDGLLSTPAASALIPRVGALAGVLLTASHNPGGPAADWGIKFNTASGAPAQDALTDRVCAEAARIGAFREAVLPGVDLAALGEAHFAGGFVAEVVDPADGYVAMLRDVFDFERLRALVRRPDFTLLFDAMHAVTGAYARRVLVEELGAHPSALLRCDPRPDFGGVHPDPNLTYAAGLVRAMRAGDAAFGAASDGDGDRNMILGAGGVFVNPADSVAIIADYAQDVIPYFADGVVGVARSMPTASALDRVAERRGFKCFETPTGWKYFTSLMDAGHVRLCGEESFGTGSSRVREKDGLWAVLAWLSILAHVNEGRAVGQLMSVRDVLVRHWATYGRTFALRHDFENVSGEAGAVVMARLRGMISNGRWPEEVEKMDEFRYVDPVDGAVAEEQGVRVWMEGGGRVVFRLSGTGSTGATVRVYFEQYEAASEQDGTVKDPSVVMSDLVDKAMRVSQIENLTGRSSPTVIT